MAKVLNTKIKQRIDTTDGWSQSSSTILENGEIGLERLTNGNLKLKIGDNSHSWAQLNYLNISAFANDAGYLTSHQSLSNYALKSELPTNPLTLSEKSGYNCNTLYDGKIWLIGSGSNCPSGSPYGALFVLPYRQASGNTSPDFGAQIFLPNGDDSTKPNSMFFRTSLKNAWNAWQEVAVDGKCNADKLDGYHVSVVNTLPSSPNASTIYFVI